MKSTIEYFTHKFVKQERKVSFSFIFVLRYFHYYVHICIYSLYAYLVYISVYTYIFAIQILNIQICIIPTAYASTLNIVCHLLLE